MEKKESSSTPIQWRKWLRRGLATAMGGGALVMVLMGAGGTGSLVYALSASEGVGLFALESQLAGWTNLFPSATAELDATPEDDTQDDIIQNSLLGETPSTDSQPAPDHDDITDISIPSVDAQDIVSRTLVPSDSIGYDTWEDIYIYNQTDLIVDVEELANTTLDISLTTSGEPQILIIHSHATEAYTPDGDNTYIPSDDYRTTDESQSIIAVGDEIQRVFTEMGLCVIHDTGLYDYPEYDGSYTRSREAVEAYLEAYPSIQIVLDIHRDALIGDDGTVYKTVTSFDNPQAAQVMVVAGSGTGDYEDWEQNLSLAIQLQQNMNALYPTLARPITMRSSLYNQDLSVGSLLVEVGCHGNTLEEAILGARYFALAAGQVLLTLVDW